MINIIPILGWLFAFIGYTSAAVPLYYLWPYVVTKYAATLVPAQYHQIPFWDVVAIVWLTRLLMWLLTPTLVRVTNNTKGN